MHLLSPANPSCHAAVYPWASSRPFITLTFPLSKTATPHAAVYTWASSRPGDQRFAEAYRQLGLHDKTLR